MVENLINEVWADIKEYEGFYQVSSFGMVRSLDRWIEYINGRSAFTRGKLINGFLKQNGYRSVDLSKGGKSKKYHVHRLVAEAFIPNDDPENKIEVNHKDENKSNNYVENLCWCTSSENKQWGTLPARRSASHKNHPSMSKPVAQYDTDGNLISTYASAKEAERQTGFFATTIIRTCRGKTLTCGGYRWKYVEDQTQ